MSTKESFLVLHWTTSHEVEATDPVDAACIVANALESRPGPGAWAKLRCYTVFRKSTGVSGRAWVAIRSQPPLCTPGHDDEHDFEPTSEPVNGVTRYRCVRCRVIMDVYRYGEGLPSRCRFIPRGETVSCERGPC